MHITTETKHKLKNILKNLSILGIVDLEEKKELQFYSI